MQDESKAAKEEDSTAKAKVSAEQLRLRLKEALAQRGGSEVLMHWLRVDEEK